MKKDVLITIQGVYSFDEDEPYEIELFTTGTYHKDGENYVITYEESDATGFEGSTTTLTVLNDEMVTLSRSGAANTQLIVQNGVRHQCYYDVGYGDMMIGVNGQSISSHLRDNGGTLSFMYSIDVNSMLASENEMFISIKESGVKNG